MKNNNSILVIIVVFMLAFSGCNAPQWRVFQSKVPSPINKPAIQIEAERQSADLVARTITAPAETIPVAQKLSESLGQPDHPITQAKPEKARDEALGGLQDGIRQSQQNLTDLNERLSKYEGKKIEGTGLNVFGFAVSLPIIGLIAMCIFFPSTIGVLWWMLKKSRGALVATIQGVQDFKADNPIVAESLNNALSYTQDAAHKALISKLKLKI